MSSLALIIKWLFDHWYTLSERLSSIAGEQSHWWNNPKSEINAEKIQPVNIILPKQSKYVWPTEYDRVTLRYGPTTLNGHPYNHTGVDIQSGVKAIKSVCAGVCIKILRPDQKYQLAVKLDKGKEVRVAPEGRGWTPYIIIDAEDGRWIYKHVKAQEDLEAGKKIKSGEVIGIAGNYGYCFGPHLHLEHYRPNGKRHDPMDILGELL